MDFGKNANSIKIIMYGEISVLLLEICLATIGVCVFRCGSFGCRTFYFFTNIKGRAKIGERKLNFATTIKN